MSSLFTFPILAQGLISGVLLGGVYALTALGLTLIFGVMRIINIAHGTVLMIGAYLTYWLFTLYGLNPFLSLLVSIPAAFLLGALLQRALIRPVIGAPELTALLVTFGISIILTNLALYVWAPDLRTVSFLSGSLRVGSLAFSTPRTVASALALGITAAALLFLKYSRTGKAIRATAQHREVAKVCGIDVHQIDLITFGLGSALTAAAGSLVSFMFAIYPEMGPLYTLKAFCVVILGGLGSSLGSLLGGLVLGIAESYASIFFSAQIAEAVAYVLLVLILLIRPQGFLGEAAKE